MELSPYLTFNGDCEAAFKLYEKVLRGKIQAMMPHEGTPAVEQVPPEWRKKILHASLLIDGQVLMASDAPPPHYKQPQGISVSLMLKDPAEAERIFRELSEGGQVFMAIQKTFWAERFAMFSDRFGIPWMINCSQA